MATMLIKAGFWLLLALCVAAYDNYDEIGSTDIKGGISYYDDNTDMDSGQFNEKIPLNDLLMFKLINSMPYSNSEEWRSRFRPLLNMVDTFGWPHKLSELDANIDVVKKQMPATKTNVKGVKVKPATRKQPRWRIKRPPGLCLLKLCSPMYYVYE